MIGMAARLRACVAVSCRAGRPPSRPCLGAGRRAALVAIGRAQPTAVLRASPSATASSGDNSTTSRPPPSSGTRITMPRPSLVTSSGPSPVRGFIAAIRHPLSCLGGRSNPQGLRRLLRCLAGPASHNHVDQYLYYPEFRPAVLTISLPAPATPGALAAP